MFFSDGRATEGETDDSMLLNKLWAWNQGNNASIFSFAIGNGADTSLLKQISCEFNGEM